MGGGVGGGGGSGVCVCVNACVRACVRAYVYVRACVRMYMRFSFQDTLIQNKASATQERRLSHTVLTAMKIKCPSRPPPLLRHIN